MNQAVATRAYVEFEFMNKAMNRINELIALCNQAEGERDQLQEKVARLTGALKQIQAVMRTSAWFDDLEKIGPIVDEALNNP